MKNILGTIRSSKLNQKREYYHDALQFFDDVVVINPQEVFYRFDRCEDVPVIVNNDGCVLNGLSMMLLDMNEKKYHQSSHIFLKSLLLDGCPLSDPLSSIFRPNLGKGYELLQKQGLGIGVSSYVITSMHSLDGIIKQMESDNAFPIVSKPIFGGCCRGIYKFDTPNALRNYVARYFKQINNILIFEKFVNYVSEWRVYMTDGVFITSYERRKAEGKLCVNLDEGGTMHPTQPDDERALKTFISTFLPPEYNTGVYGIDIGMDDQNNFYLIEVNRTAGVKHVLELTGVNVPYESMKILFMRARKFDRS